MKSLTYALTVWLPTQIHTLHAAWDLPDTYPILPDDLANAMKPNTLRLKILQLVAEMQDKVSSSLTKTGKHKQYFNKKFSRIPIITIRQQMYIQQAIHMLILDSNKTSTMFNKML